MNSLAALLLLGFVALTQATYCPCPNEVWSKCGANDCQPSCNPKIPNPKSCKCCPGCICKDGYFRNSKGVCVLPEHCDMCGKDQIFSTCKECQNTCDNPTLSQVCKPKRPCPPGCVCRSGLLLNSKNQCVEPNKCDSCRGDKDKVWNPCGNVCPKTCENKDPICPKICKPGDCVCREGLVELKGKCIKPDKCPPKKCDDPNAEVVKCPNPCPGGTCSQPEFSPCKKACPAYGCQCKKGYVKSPCGKCILQCDCPK